MYEQCGVMGARCYTYIKSFENEKRYNFNDDNVSPILEEEIAKIYVDKY